MKFGMRTPNPTKSFKARTTGRIKRAAKSSYNPTYGMKGSGLLKNPKKSVYNKVYNKTTASIFDLPKNKRGKQNKYIDATFDDYTPNIEMDTEYPLPFQNPPQIEEQTFMPFRISYDDATTKKAEVEGQITDVSLKIFGALLGIIILSAFLIYNHFDLWELIVVFALIFTIFSNAPKYFALRSTKSTLKELIKLDNENLEDIENIHTIYTLYETLKDDIISYSETNLSLKEKLHKALSIRENAAQYNELFDTLNLDAINVLSISNDIEYSKNYFNHWEEVFNSDEYILNQIFNEYDQYLENIEKSTNKNMLSKNINLFVDEIKPLKPLMSNSTIKKLNNVINELEEKIERELNS
jgi:hypothetical protein